MRLFFITLILTWSSFCNSAEVDIDFWVQRWKNESAWVKDLPREDQSVVIHLLIKRLTDRMSEAFAPQAKKAGEKRLVMKIFFDGVALLPDLATHSPELRKSLEAFGDMAQRFESRQIKPSQLGVEMESNDRRMDLVLAAVPPHYFHTVPVQYKHLLARTTAAIYVTALKLNGWQHSED